MDNPVIEKIKGFVSGEMDVEEFKNFLYESEEIEAVLKNDPHLSASNYVGGDVYLFLLERDYDRPGEVLSAQGALCDFMDRNGYPYEKTKQYSQQYDVLLSAQPKWLSIDSKYLKENFLDRADEKLTKTELKKWLSREIKKRFKYIKKPPSWIQDPQWPINENGPLVFLGQIDLGTYFHDTSAVYVFHDPKTGVCETIIQVM